MKEAGEELSKKIHRPALAQIGLAYQFWILSPWLPARRGSPALPVFRGVAADRRW
jgi:hypothetical protein